VIVCFLESKDFEDTVRLAVSLGGDSDTLACITVSMSESACGTDNIQEQVKLASIVNIPRDLSAIYHSFLQKFVTKKTNITLTHITACTHKL
jgi:ADP-ribosylglycohydrolase